MNLDDELYKDILENGLLLDHYFLLCKIKNGKSLVNTKRIQGFVNLLVKKGYIDDNTGALTEKGDELVANCGLSDVVSVTETTTKIDFGTWAMKLHQKCQDELFRLTGQKQARARILDRPTGRKKSYSFLCNATDLATTMLKAVKTYKLTDFEKIEDALLGHIRDCAKSNDWFPLMQYYIMKDGNSKMVTDLDTIREKEINVKSTQKFL